MMRHRNPQLVWAVGLLAWIPAGCHEPYNGHGIIYGCDGSGAGVFLRWGPTARRGMTDAGFKGIMEPYRWQTGAGFAVDHLSSPAYKRKAAQGLAKRITDHQEQYPDDPIYLAGLSAGCAVVLYALEQLPAGVTVDQVVLASPSVSADYDMLSALRGVRGRIYAFISSRDKVLSGLASKFGTADGKRAGTDISGLKGFRPPGESGGEFAYGGKLRNIAWRPEFAQYGHRGGHTDVVASRFVQHFVAPLIVPARTPHAASRPAGSQ